MLVLSLEKYDQKLAETTFSAAFRDNSRQEVAGDVISRMAVDRVGMDVFQIFDDLLQKLFPCCQIRVIYTF